MRMSASPQLNQKVWRNSERPGEKAGKQGRGCGERAAAGETRAEVWEHSDFAERDVVSVEGQHSMNK